MQADGTQPRTPIAVLATTEESLHSSMTEAMLTEGGKNMRHGDLIITAATSHLLHSSVMILPSLYQNDLRQRNPFAR